MSSVFNATVLTGEGSTTLLSGETNRYDMERGFTIHAIGDKNPGIIIQVSIELRIPFFSYFTFDKRVRVSFVHCCRDRLAENQRKLTYFLISVIS